MGHQNINIYPHIITRGHLGFLRSTTQYLFSHSHGIFHLKINHPRNTHITRLRKHPIKTLKNTDQIHIIKKKGLDRENKPSQLLKACAQFAGEPWQRQSYLTSSSGILKLKTGGSSWMTMRKQKDPHPSMPSYHKIRTNFMKNRIFSRRKINNNQLKKDGFAMKTDLRDERWRRRSNSRRSSHLGA